MYYHLIPLPLSILLIILYMISRNKNDLKRTAIIQPVATLVAMIIAALSLLSPYVNMDYTIWILVGMGLCLLADIFNIDMTNDKVYMLQSQFLSWHTWNMPSRIQSSVAFMLKISSSVRFFWVFTFT